MISRRGVLTVPLLAGAENLVPVGSGAQPTSSNPAGPDGSGTQKAIWKAYYEGTRVWGYADKHSVNSGERFTVMLSTGPKVQAITGRIEVLRIGYYGKSDRKLVYTGSPVRVTQNDVQMTTASLGGAWPLGCEIATDGWQSGYYTINFIDDSDGRRDLDVAFMVVTNPEKSGDILLELSTNTYQAYNEWGGCSLYKSAFTGDRAQVVSFDRPTPPSFLEYEYYLVLWLEQLAAEEHLTIDYATNFDIYRDTEFCEKCRLLISGSHNEYWSKEEFDRVYRRIFELGRHTFFVGANTAYWQVRYGDLDRVGADPSRGRQLICYKDQEDPIRHRVSQNEASLLITALFRDNARRPETMLVGIAYQNWFDPSTPAKYPYFVARTDLPFFAGTGYREGDAIGDIVGYEWDNTDPDGDGRRLWDPQKSRIARLDPSLIKVVFQGAPVDVDGKQGKAEAVYFISPAGAKVFSTGSIRWAWGLGKPGFAQEKFKMFNRNLVMHLLQYD